MPRLKPLAPAQPAAGQPLPALLTQAGQAPAPPAQPWRSLWRQIAGITPKMLGRLALALIAVSVAIWIAVASWPALLPFIFGGLIAYTVLPLVDALDRILPRFVASLVAVLLALAILAGLAYIVIPPLVNELLRLIDALPGQAKIQALAEQIAADARFSQLPAVIQRQVLVMLTDTFGRLQPAAEQIPLALFSSNPLRTVITTFSSILGLIVLPTWALMLLKDQPRAWPGVANVLPPSLRRDARAYIRIADNAFGTFLRGQVIIGMAVGLATYVGLSLLEQFADVDLRYKLPLAVFAGLLQLIPEIGPLLNTLGATLLAWLGHGGLVALAFLALYIAIQALVRKLLADRFEHRLLDVHPAILVLVIVALSELGPLWFFLAAPVASVARDVWRYTYGRLREPALPPGVIPAEREAYLRSLARQKAARPRPAVYRRR